MKLEEALDTGVHVLECWLKSLPEQKDWRYLECLLRCADEEWQRRELIKGVLGATATWVRWTGSLPWPHGDRGL